MGPAVLEDGSRMECDRQGRGPWMGQVSDLTVTEARVALAKWSAHVADEDTTTVPPRVGEDAAVRARAGHTFLAESS